MTIADLPDLARDSFYVTIGLGLIAFQNVQHHLDSLRRAIVDHDA